MGTSRPAHVLTPSSTYRRVLNMTALAAAQAGQPLTAVKRAVGA
jgi:malate dehydrogenase (oxaloacetate-decarboxylating)(NADP+)